LGPSLTGYPPLERQSHEGGEMSVKTEVEKLLKERDLSSISQKFRESGLDEQLSSWISKGQNLPVVGPQIERALGSDAVAGIASRLGITQEQAADELAEAVPEVVDEMTPEGELPTQTGAGDQASA
jgi:uncharacterized protein YidB (DUF937 family)